MFLFKKKMWRKALLFSLFLFLSSCKKEEVVLTDGKVIGEGDLVKNEHVVQKVNFNGTAFCDRIAIFKTSPSYQMHEVGRTLEEGVYQLKLLQDNGVATIEKIGIRSSAVYFHDLLIRLENGDVLHTEGFEVLPYKSPSFHPQKIQEGLYYVSKKSGFVPPGRYHIQQEGGAVYLQQFPLEYLDMQGFYQSQNDYIDVKEGNYLIVTKGASLVPDLLEQKTKDHIHFDVPENMDEPSDDMDVFLEELEQQEVNEDPLEEPLSDVISE